MVHPDITGRINSILLQTAIKADPIIDRNAAQKALRVAKMREELIDLGYSIVTTVWLDEVLREMPLVGREGSK